MRRKRTHPATDSSGEGDRAAQAHPQVIASPFIILMLPVMGGTRAAQAPPPPIIRSKSTRAAQATPSPIIRSKSTSAAQAPPPPIIRRSRPYNDDGKSMIG